MCARRCARRLARRAPSFEPNPNPHQTLTLILNPNPRQARAPSFERKLAWRDLSAWSLWRFPDLSDEPFRKHYGT
jgi:hypothetical protein